MAAGGLRQNFLRDFVQVPRDLRPHGAEASTCGPASAGGDGDGAAAAPGRGDMNERDHTNHKRSIDSAAWARQAAQVST